MLKRNICKYETQLRDAKELVVGNISHNEGSTIEIPEFPRYVRVNTLKSSTKDVYSILKSAIHEKETGSENTMSNQIYKDVHIPNLLILSPESASKFELYKHPLVTDGNIVLQDKSSCFSALALIHGGGKIIDEQCDFIDACAAPGNKTTHLTALVASARESGMKNMEKQAKKKQKKSKIFALDKSPTRVKTLQQRIVNFVPSTSPYVEVHAHHQDFLKIMPDDPDYKNVKAILLDPSCSGSGIINSIDRFYLDQSDESKSKEELRVKKVAEFQKIALLHAMSFHHVERIVYSTCSIHDEENEIVVATALHDHNKKSNDSKKWKLVPPSALNGWSRRGHSDIELSDNSMEWTEKEAKCCIRVDGHKGDQTNGFFVACFERAHSNDETSESKSVDYGCDSIPFYNNEYNNETKISRETDENKKHVVEEKNSNDKSENEKEPSSQKNTKSSHLNEQKSAKKRAKKQAWKQKQREQKLMRMKKREEKKST